MDAGFSDPGVIEHIRLRGKCSQCGAEEGYAVPSQDPVNTGVHFVAYCVLRHPQGYSFNHRTEILGLPPEDDSFEVSPDQKMRILSRDCYLCIYCGRPAPIVVSPVQYIDQALSEALGTAWSSDGLQHDSSICPTCSQYLPGILRVVPAGLLLGLDQRARERIYAFLQSLQLHVHHPVPKALLKRLFRNDQDRKKYRAEFDLAVNRLHVTACNNCNAGIGARLAAFEEIDQVLQNVVHQGGGLMYAQDRQALQGLHFRARLLLRSATG